MRAASKVAKQKVDPAVRRQKQLEYRLRATYGITIEEYLAFGTACHICGDEGTALDHCHSTGKVRGLLCRPCNIALGLFRDRPDLLTAAARYLEG
jgi:hypothetical protein